MFRTATRASGPGPPVAPGEVAVRRLAEDRPRAARLRLEADAPHRHLVRGGPEPADDVGTGGAGGRAAGQVRLDVAHRDLRVRHWHAVRPGDRAADRAR